MILERLPFPKTFQSLDRVAIALMVSLTIVIGLLLAIGVHTVPRVRDFSWQRKIISAEDTAFILSFSRPMDRASVEQNLKIEPPLPGKFSWAGRRMAYTLISPAPYGTKFKLNLSNAQDRFEQNSADNTVRPFVGEFKTRDRAFVYIGIAGEEAERLVLYNLTQQQKQILTPPELAVMEFKPYQSRDRIVFSASERRAQAKGLNEQKLYTVTTGLTATSEDQAAIAGKVELVVDNKDYQNLKFDITPDGETLVVQRLNRRNPADAKLWTVQPGKRPKPLNNQPGGDFLMTPDSSAIAMAQGEGVAILPIKPEAEPLDFLPKFGTVLSFSGDGSAATMVKFNQDYTRSLFLVTNQGTQKKLFDTTGSILNCQFDPTQTQLYCLLTQLLPGETYQELPYIAAIDLKTGKETPLVALPDQRDTQISLSPDGLALLFDQAVVDPNSQKQGLSTSDGKAIATSLLWLLPLADVSPEEGKQILLKPEELPFKGFRPRWLP